MGENEQMNATGGKLGFTVKRVLKVLLLLCIIFVFCPSFLVSCSGQDVNVSVMTAVGGVSMYGEKVVDPYPIMLICLLLPAAMFVLLFMKKLVDNRAGIMILAGAAIDLVVWIIFRNAVKKVAEENYCEFKSTVWFVLNVIVLVLIILLTALVALGKTQMDSELTTVFTQGGTRRALSQMSGAVSQMVGNVAANMGNKVSEKDRIGFCSKCGSPISYGTKFCISCGTAVPESMIVEAEAARKAAEEAARKAAEEAASHVAEGAQDDGRGSVFCQQCGAKLRADAKFCESCGAKVE